MPKFNPYESFIFESCVRVPDLVRVVNQLYQDQMQYAKIAMTYCENEDYAGDVQIYAIPSAGSNDIKKYPVIKNITSVDIDTILLD